MKLHRGQLCNHDIGGPDRTIAFLHGLGSSASAEFPAVAGDSSLSSHRSILIDLPGFGFSDRPVSFSYSLEDCAGVVADLLDSIDVRRATLVGHSWGGSMAIVLAARRPDLISTLIVAEPNLLPEDATMSQAIADQSETDFIDSGYSQLIRQSNLGSASTPGFRGYARTLRAADPIALHRASTSLVQAKLETTLFDLPIPNAYIFGEQSLPHRHRDLLSYANVPMYVIVGAGHDMIVQKPVETARAIADFVGRIE